MVLVGAINVAAIETVWAGLITPPNGRDAVHRDYDNDAPTLATGEEMGRFFLGSTIVVCFGKDKMHWLEDMQAERPVRLGESIGLTLE